MQGVNRLLVIAGAAALALLFVHRPPAPAGVITTASVAPPSQGSRKGHPSGDPANAVVYVVGAVKRPGLYRVPAGARVNDAVLRAGGLLPQADPAAVNLAQRLSDGEEIRVLRAGETAVTQPRSSRSRARKRSPGASAAASAIELNSADAATLASLPGIGATLAERIVEYRNINGPFASLDELADVGGMTQRRVDAVSPFLTLRGER